MTVPASVLVVGGGMAGFTVVSQLRGLGFEGALSLVDPEGYPYDRPPLSKEYLDGRQQADSLLFAAAEWYEDNGVEVIAERAVGARVDPLTVTLGSGREVSAEAVVLALGGRARTLPVPGGDLDGIAYLRTKADADRLRGVLAPGHRLVIVGAGLIGSEVASTAVSAGAEVTLVDPVEIPAVPTLGQAVALRLHRLHAEHGVRVVTAPTTSIARENEEWVLQTDDGPKAGGQEVRADTVLVAIGIVPEVALGVEMGLDVEDGILVDEGQRTSVPGVYAVGDVARLRREEGAPERRHEHWDSAMQDGQAAAAAIMGRDLPARSAPWMWTDRYGLHAQATGSMQGGDLVIRGADDEPDVVFRVGQDGRLLGAAAPDDPKSVRFARRLIDRGVTVDAEALADPSVDLRKLGR